MTSGEQEQRLILLVDDSPTQALYTRAVLESAGFRVKHALNGAEAIRFAHQIHPDVVLSDVLMPVMDGFTMCRELRSDPSFAHVPLILYTATFVETQDETFALGLGATRYLVKPSDPHDIIAHVQSVIAMQIAPPTTPVPDIDTFVQSYSERLATTLERKVAELETANQRLADQNLQLTATRDQLSELLEQRAHVEMVLRRERNFTAAVLDTVSALVMVLDQEGRIVDFNRACEHISGYSLDEVRDRPYWDFLLDRTEIEPAKTIFAAVQSGSSTAAHEHYWVARNGERHLIVWTNTALLDEVGSVEYVIGTGLDITERKQFEAQLAHMAFHDTLTNLPNRALFMDRLGHAIARAARYDETCVVLFVDLDRFKIINDSLGHIAGDQLLISVAQRLATALRAPDSVVGSDADAPVLDTIARLGGDEFGILLENIRNVHDAVRIAERLLNQLRVPLYVDNQEVFTSASVGIALSTPEHRRPEDLVRDADVAMYRAKNHGRSRYEVFDPSMNARALEHLELEMLLRRALERSEFRVYYQPKVNLATGQIYAFEALLRWERPDVGLIAPIRFIPLAEETGLILPIGQWVLREACRQMRAWQSEHPAATGVSVSVNISARQFQHPGLVDDIAHALEETGLEPSSLIIEITESVAMQDGEATITALDTLRALGIRFAIDDFGTGYSSLSYLKRFAFHILKIDRTFISGNGKTIADLAVVRAALMLAQSMDLEVVAEGVETAAQAEHLLGLGCTLGQGYYFARPQPYDVVGGFLRTKATLPSAAPSSS